MQNAVKLPVKRLRWSLRIVFWITFLCIVLAILANKFATLETTTYAYTYSFGGGWGYVFHTSLYYELPPVLRENVDVHEEAHLAEGTYRIWDHTAAERRAYQAQLTHCRKRKAEYQQIYEQTRSVTARSQYTILSSWEKDILESLEELEKKN